MRFSLRQSLAIVCCMLLLASCKTKKEVTDENTSPYTFEFVSATSIVELADIAKEQNKLVFIDVYTDWCMPCKLMDEDVFSDKKLGKFFNENFISYKADAESMPGADIALLYEVLGYPTLLFIDAQGKLLVKKTGIAYQREMYELADEAIYMSQQTEGE